MTASMLFIILMMPRCILYTMRLKDDQQDPQHARGDIHAILDSIAWCLQYLNHSINLFIYMLFIKRFRICGSVKLHKRSERTKLSDQINCEKQRETLSSPCVLRSVSIKANDAEIKQATNPSPLSRNLI